MSRLRGIIAISGGGTGGHIFPALSVIEELKKRGIGTIYIGSSSGLERDLVRNRDGLYLLPTTGWVDKKLPGKIEFVLRFIPSLIFSLWLLSSRRVNAVFHTGGFASLPAGIAALILKKPLFTLILDSEPGRTAELLAKFSREVFLPYSAGFSGIKNEKVTVTGIPIRRSIAFGNREESINYFSLSEDRKTVLVIGGSRGARKLVEITEGLVEELDEEEWQFIVQTGKHRMKKTGDNVMQMDFIERMGLAYSVADVIIARAGALTTAEIQHLGKPALLIPYPYAFRDHQYSNAVRLAEESRNIRVVREEEVRMDELVDLLNEISGREETVKRKFAQEKIVERMEKHVWKN